MADEDIYNLPITTSDASAMLRRKVKANDNEVTATVVKLNNKMVDGWRKDVLEKISDQRCSVPSGRVWHSWQLYDEGHSILEYNRLDEEGYMPDFPENILEFWKSFFEELTVEELHAYGSGNISYGWTIITTAIKRYFAEEKYDKLYGIYDTPLEWEKNHYSHKSLLHGENLPFWNRDIFKDIREKVSAVLMNQVIPDPEKIKNKLTRKEAISMLKRKSSRLDRPFVKETTNCNNSQIDKWAKTLTETEFTPQRVMKLWSIYHEGYCLAKRQKLLNEGVIFKPSREILTKWIDLFENSDISKLHSLGTGVVNYGWSLIQADVRETISENKQVIYGAYEPREWYDHIDAIEETEKKLPYWDESILERITVNVSAILGITVQPQQASSFR